MITLVPEVIRHALILLQESGYEAYLVGGCVRDLYMQKDPHDYDLTTNATPKQIQSCFRSHKQIDIGIKHGTIIVFMEATPIEITTYRIDNDYIDHRHPNEVTFTTSLISDCQRRDFTINAFCLSVDDEFLDFFEGKTDIQNRIIRCIGNPNERFQEDALRILRAIRFASRLQFKIDPTTKEAMLKNKKLLLHLSNERVFQELSEIICTESFADYFLEYLEIFEILFPSLLNLEQFPKQLQLTYELLANSPTTLVHRFLALFYAYPSVQGRQNQSYLIAKALKKLTAPKKIVEQINTILLHMDDPAEDRIAIKKILSQTDLLLTRQLLIFREIMEPLNRLLILEQILSSGSCYNLKQLKFTGKDCLALQVKNQEIQLLLRHLLNEVIEERLDNQPIVLLEAAQHWIAG